ncbi:diguanylate cyclase (GGDEF) domain-containing protein [Pseudoxanthomonas sp. GM95]|uniref:ligand-binding sensor domain-containing diguanylate cyclase n=1 Tax=Pseudoxanthomonas sp. GM95 TaxID=1881043 RepID=UPI0008B662F2|nr:diguanylate cyclase [Pseudoxanthomonas sp. GM95]SEL75588.1 diguanylate cyclase (GGDEF) domain-containing protein [Pseudoxanthomonas sp. GM95]
MSRIGALLWMLLCLAVPADAQAPASAPAPVKPLDLMNLGAPAFTNFTTRDGLPDAGMMATCVDREGFVWGATPAGVYRYDAHRWVLSSDPAMNHSATDVFLDHQGTLWAAFRNTGLARYDGKHWHAESVESGLPSNQIRRFAETVDAKGASTLWALTWDLGLMRLVDGRWQLDAGNASLPADPLRSMTQTQQLGAPGRQWLGTNARGLWYRDAGQRDWHRWEGHQLDAAQVEDMLPVLRDGREELWISTYTGGLWRMRADSMRHWSQQQGDFPSNVTYSIASTALPDGNRAIWVASRSGLLRFAGDTMQVFNRRHGMRSDVIRDVSAWRSPDGLDVLWMATDTGVSRTALGASPWSIASLLGIDSLGVFGFLVEPDGHGSERLWVSSAGEGLALYENGDWHRFTESEGVPINANIGSVIATPDADGRKTYWVSLRGGALLRRRPDDTRFYSIPTPWKQTTGEMLYDTLVRTYEGHREQWFATRETGMYRLRDGVWTKFPPPDANAPWRAMRVREVIDRSGRSWLWAATNQGLSRFDGTQWEPLAKTLGLPETNAIGLTQIDDAQHRQILWVGTSSAGVTRVDVTDPQHPRMLTQALPTPPDPSVYNVSPDSAGRIYLCTNNGVQLLTPTAQGFESRIFTRRDGMVHQECNYVHMVDAHDRFWTGTLGGLAVYDPQRELHDTQPKPLRLTGLQIDGHPVEGATLDVPAGAKEIRIDYALLSWYREADSRFRTQLVGYDPAPSDWTDQNFRTFNSLPPGRYTLRIEGRDHADNASTPIEIAMVLHPQWWQQLWVRIAGAIALLLLGYGVILLRTRQLRAQRNALEQHIAARTAELNIANARLIDLSYQDALTGLANRRRLLEALEQPAAATTLILLDVDHFKQYNDRFGHLAGDEALRCVAHALRDCAGPDVLVARYGGEEFACLLTDTDPDAASALAECIRAAVATCEIPVPGETQTMRVTISAGIAHTALTAPEDALRLLRHADLALYQAKHEGRNRVRHYGVDAPSPDSATA